MNRLVTGFALLFAAALTATIAVPSVSAAPPFILWEGEVFYDLNADGSVTLVDATPGCGVSPTWEPGPVEVSTFDSELYNFHGAGTAFCVPDLPIELTAGRTPSCKAYGYAHFLPVTVGIIHGHAWCRGSAGQVDNYCVTAGGLCAVSAALTPANSGGCSFIAKGITVIPPGGVRAYCKVRIVYV